MDGTQGSRKLPLEGARLVQIDMLDEDNILAVFSNGEAVRIASSDVKALALKVSPSGHRS